MRPSGQFRPVRLWWSVRGWWTMMSTLIVRTLSCVCSVPLARHGDTESESGTRCAAPSTHLQGLGHGVGWDRGVTPFAACCLVVWLLGGWERAGLCGGTCVARHLGCTRRLHAPVRSAPTGAVRPWHVVARVWAVLDVFDTDHSNIVLCVLRAFGSPRQHSL